ncbi:hypothetical protein [Streptomyces olivaceoviridis]|uniref:hypothetical protein n=1 Tax=Streptomyces olivaceoviridis TaxID=1921 RepID=UPI00333011FC
MILVQQYVVLDPGAVQAATPAQLESYLTSKGWVRAEITPPALQMWIRPQGEPLPDHLRALPARRAHLIWPGHITSPTRHHQRDYVARVDELLITLGLFERRLASDVLADIHDLTTSEATEELEDLRGSMMDGYTSEDVNRVFARIEEATGVRLTCLWDYCDAYGYGGNSQFYVEDADGRLYELAGDLWAWLNGDPTAHHTPNSPGAPASWRGAAAEVPEPAGGDDFYNLAQVDDQD